MNIGVFGRTRYLLQSVEKLHNEGHKIKFIYTCKAEKYYDKKEIDFQKLAQKIGCKFFYGLDISKNLKFIEKLDVDVCISFNWLNIIKKEILNKFKYGILNLHMGDLPRYKGNACPNWAILNFEKKIALTLFKMTEALDSGPIIKKLFFKINKKTYITEVYKWIDNVAPKIYLDSINKIHKIKPVQQNKKIKTLRCYPRKPIDSKINWNDTSLNILALIRASSFPFDGAFTFLNENKNHKVRVFKASKYNVNFKANYINGQVCFFKDNKIIVGCSDGFIILENYKLNNFSKKNSFKQICHSLRNRLT